MKSNFSNFNYQKSRSSLFEKNNTDHNYSNRNNTNTDKIEKIREEDKEISEKNILLTEEISHVEKLPFEEEYTSSSNSFKSEMNLFDKFKKKYSPKVETRNFQRKNTAKFFKSQLFSNVSELKKDYENKKEIDNILAFDKVKNYKRYFIHNNFENVIKIQNIIRNENARKNFNLNDSYTSPRRRSSFHSTKFNLRKKYSRIVKTRCKQIKRIRLKFIFRGIILKVVNGLKLFNNENKKIEIPKKKIIVIKRANSIS